jgi:hypothetical protein
VAQVQLQNFGSQKLAAAVEASVALAHEADLSR